MIVGEVARPAFQTRNMTDESDELDHHSLLIASDEEIDACSTKAGHQKEHNAHPYIDGENAKRNQYEIDHNARGPEPEVGKDVHHGEEEYTRGGSLGADVGLQLHDFVGFTSHQSCWCRVVKRKACDGEFEDSPERDGTWT